MSNKEEKRAAGLTAKGEKRKFVKHEYVDKAGEVYDCTCKSDRDIVKLYTDGNVSGPFPLKLLTLLALIEKLGMDDIISWQPHGRSFQVRKPKDFEQIVMKRFFNQTKISSFRRQLNLYDFKRITHGPDSGSYYHEMFLRGKPLQASKMVRTKVKGTKFRATSSPDAEPNFYTLPFLPPTHSKESTAKKIDGSVPDATTSDSGFFGRENGNKSHTSLHNATTGKSNTELSTSMDMNVFPPVMSATGAYAPNHLYQLNQLLASSGSLNNLPCMQPNLHPNLQMAHAVSNTNSASINTPGIFTPLQNMQMIHQQVDNRGNDDSKSSTSILKGSYLDKKNNTSEVGLNGVQLRSSGDAITTSSSLPNSECGGYDDMQRAFFMSHLQHQAQSSSAANLGMKFNAGGGGSNGSCMSLQQNVQSEKGNEKSNIQPSVCSAAGSSQNSTSV